MHRTQLASHSNWNENQDGDNIAWVEDSISLVRCSDGCRTRAPVAGSGSARCASKSETICPTHAPRGSTTGRADAILLHPHPKINRKSSHQEAIRRERFAASLHDPRPTNSTPTPTPTHIPVRYDTATAHYSKTNPARTPYVYAPCRSNPRPWESRPLAYVPPRPRRSHYRPHCHPHSPSAYSACRG